MPDYNHHKSPCAFAEQLISYLYDEATAREKAAFDAHLSNCSNCTDELADFGFVRSSIVGWKNTEFSNLETPSIEIPYSAMVSIEKQSWLDALRRIFTLSPAWSTAFAAFAICAGLIFLGLNFSKNSEIANDIKKPVETTVSPIIQKRVEQPVNEIKPEIVVQTHTIEQPKQSETAPRDSSKNQIVKASKSAPSNRRIRQNSNNPVNVRKINENKDALTAQKQSVPQLNSLEEEEDNSLRLADLFIEDEGR